MKSHRRHVVNRALLPRLGWVMVLTLLFPQIAAGQGEDTGWSPPELIVQTSGTLATSPIALVADQAGGLHLFFSHSPDETSPSSIDYVSWNGSEWSRPVDVLMTGGGALRGGAIDSRQVVHLLWLDQGRALMHASAEVAQAWSPRAWSSPQRVAQGLVSGDIAVGPDDTLYVVYGDPALTDSVSLVTSTDGGERWSEPQPLASSGSGEVGIGEVSAAVDNEGRLHVVWAEYELPDGWPPAGVFYARSSAETAESALLLQVAREGYGHPGVATVGEDEVHLVWSSGVGGDGAYHTWSSDGGESWAPPDIYERGRGLSGRPSLATDSEGRLHYALGDARSAGWQEGLQIPYVDVAGEELRTGTNQGEGWTAPERAEMAITTGNRLHVVFETGFQNLWHTSRLLDAPPVPTSELPAVRVTSTPKPATPEPEATAEPDPTAVLAAAPMEGSSPAAGGRLAAVIAGVAASALVVLVAVIWKLMRGWDH